MILHDLQFSPTGWRKTSVESMEGSPEQLANSLIVAVRRLCMTTRSVYICHRLAEV